MSSFQGACDVWFSLRNTTYQTNSIVMLEDIGEGDDDALLCELTKLLVVECLVLVKWGVP